MDLLWELPNIQQIVDLGPKMLSSKWFLWYDEIVYNLCLCIFVFLRYFTLSRPMVLRIYCQNSWHTGLTAIKLDTISIYKSFSIQYWHHHQARYHLYLKIILFFSEKCKMVVVGVGWWWTAIIIKLPSLFISHFPYFDWLIRISSTWPQHN